MENLKETVGKLGENLACAYLRKKSYFILERNYREKFDEIDIIAKDKNNVLVFIEVKTMILNKNLKPEDNFTKQKSKRIQRACTLFAVKHSKLIHQKRGWRIDLIAITIDKNNNCFEINHYENV